MATPSGSISISATIDTSAAERDVLAALRRIEKKSSLNLDTKNFSQPLGRITGQANEFQKSLEASNARVIAFGASAGIIYNIQKAFSALVSSTLDVEKSLTDINVVLNSSAKSLNQFGDQLFNIAKQTGASFNTVTEAAIEFSRQGLSVEDTLKRTRDALILTRLAGLDVVSSTEALTSAVNSFTKEALTTTDVVNKLAAVDAKFAVSSRDLSEAIKRVGSSASEAGVSFDELLGIVTSVQQTTARGGAVIGNALKTIFTRVQRPDVINDLRDFGVTVKNLEGDTLPIIQVLQNLATSFENLNPVVKAQVAELVGGVFQINILKASLSDLAKQNSIFQAATTASNKAIDDAIIKNETLNKTISALISETGNNLTQFGKNIGSVSVAPGIKKLVTLLNDNLAQINEKSGESVGAKIGAGLLEGITNFITGPGLVLGSVVLGKLFGRFAGFSTDAAKSFLGLNTITQQQSRLQEQIKVSLESNPAILGQIISGEKTRLQVEKEIRDVLVQQSALAENIRINSESFSKSLISSGVGVSASNIVTSNRGTIKRTSQGFLPNFAGSLAPQMQSEVFEAKKLGAQGNVKAKLSKGTIGGKRFILNTAETELVGFGRNGDSAVIPSYGDGFNKAMQKIASGKAGSVLGGVNASGMSFGGFIPNFAEGENRVADYKEWLRRKGRGFRVDKVRDPKTGALVATPQMYNLSDKKYFESLSQKEIADFESELKQFQSESNTTWAPTGYVNYLRAVSTTKTREERKGARSSLAIPERLPDKPTIDAAVIVATMSNFKDFIEANYPAESVQKQAISKKLRIINDQLKTADSLQKEGKPIPVQLSQRLDRLKKFQKIYQEQQSKVSQVPAKAFGEKYEDFALNFLKKSGFPNVQSAASAGLYGTGGDKTTDVDAVDTAKRAFFEFKSGEISINDTNKKFKNVRSRPENWPLLLGVKLSDAFDKVKGSWQDILVSNRLRDPVYNFLGNKILRLPFGESSTQDKKVYANIPSEKRKGQRATAIGSFQGSLTQFIDEEYSRIMMEKPKSYSKGFIPNFAAENLGKFKLNDRIVMAYGKKNDPESIAKYLVNIGRINPLFDKAKNPVLDSKGQQVVQFSGYTTKYGSEGYQNLIRHFRSDGVLDYRIVPSNDEKSITSYLRQIRLSDFSSGFLPNFNKSKNNLKDLLNVAKLKSFSSPEDLYYWLTRLAQEKGLRIDQEGSSRIGIPLDENTWLKIASNKAGIAQNFIENRILNNKSARNKYSSILPEIFASDNKNNLWNIVERLTPVDQGFINDRRNFDKMAGKPMSQFLQYGPFTDLEKLIFDLEKEYKVMKHEFYGGRNLGYTNERNRRIKLMDVGLTPGVLNFMTNYPRFQERGRFKKGFIPNFASEKLKTALKQKTNLLPNGNAIYNKLLESDISDSGLIRAALKFGINLSEFDVPPAGLNFRNISTVDVPELDFKSVPGQIRMGYWDQKTGETKFRVIQANMLSQLISDLRQGGHKEISISGAELPNIRQQLNALNISNTPLQQASSGYQYFPLAKGFIPNFANYADSVMQLEKNLSGSTAILDTTTGPYPFIRNSKQANFADAVADHGGVANALKDSMQMQTSAGLLKNKGFIPNFADGNLDSFDLGILTASVFALGTQIKSVSDSFKAVKDSSNSIKNALQEDVKGIKQSARERIIELNNQLKAEKAVRTQTIDAAKQNINVAKQNIAALEKQRKDEKKAFLERSAGGFGIDRFKLKEYTDSAIAIGKQIRGQENLISNEEKAMLDQKQALKVSSAEFSTKAKGIRAEATQSINEKTAEAASKLTFGAKSKEFISRAGFGIGLAGSALANVGEQFVSKENFQARAALSGFGDIASYAGTGAAFGPIGVAAGALVGAAVAAKKLADAKLEQTISNIGKSLDIVKDKANSFNNASQGYVSSLEQLKNALNDPNARPEALVRFQTLIQESLGQIPDEFRKRVLSAGSDLTKISEAIADVNKELNKSEQNLQSASNVLQQLAGKKGFLYYLGFEPEFKTREQQLLNRSFTRNINQENLVKRFGSQQGFDQFISNLSNQLFTQQKSGRGFQANAPTIINQTNLDQVQNLLQTNGLLTEELASAFQEAAQTVNVKTMRDLVKALRDVGITAFATKEESENLALIQADNVKKNKASAEALKLLNQQYTNLNLQLSKQIQIEQNRSTSIRDINKIFSEGVINVQRSRVKNLLDAASPFITDQQRNDIQNQLDLNDVVNRQNSQIRDALNKTLDSFNDNLTVKIKEITDQVVGVTTDLNRDPNQNVRETNVFIKNLNALSNLVRQGLEETSSGGNIVDIQNKLVREIKSTTTLTGGQQEVLILQLKENFSNFENELARIKAQGDIDLLIQKGQIDFQRKTYELNQRLSFAGGARALASTGQLGVSELYDNIADLVGELRRNNVIGSSGQNISMLGSSVFKLLDVLTNQLQLNRATTSPIPFTSPESFNKAVSDQLRPLVAISIAGRTRQIRESLGLARETTEIQLGRPIGKGSPLGRAFETANQNAVQTALLQISSELKLQNIGGYLDVLQEEARYLNQLTEEQTKLLKAQTPSLQTTFEKVIKDNVGSNLTSLKDSLTSKLTELTIATKEADIQKQIRDLIPSDIPFGDRDKFLQDIRSLREGTYAPVSILPATQSNITTVPSIDALFKGVNGFGTAASLPFTTQPITPPATSALGVSSISNRYGATSGTIDSIIDLIKKLETFKSSIAGNTPSWQLLMKQALDKLKNPEGMTNTTGQAQNQQTFINPSDRLQQIRAEIDKLNSQTDVYLKNNTELVKLQAEVNKILEEGVNTAEQKKKLTEVEIKLRKQELDIQLKTAKDREDLLYNTDYGRTFFREEKQAAAEARIAAEARQGNVAVGSIARSTFQYGAADAAKDTGDTLKIVLSDFKTGVAGAFSEAIKGTKTLREAFADFFQSLVNRLTDRATTQLVDTILGAVQGGVSTYFGSRSTSTSSSFTPAESNGAYVAGGINTVTGAGAKKYGGLIKGYNFGGLVTGGSGFRDDVPAMMSGGEFVIKQSSVKKYGADFLDQLNSGQIQTAADGGSFSVGPMRNEFVYNDPERPTSGEYSIDPRLSAFALTDENNPQNKIREQRFEELDRYLLDKDQYDKDRKKAINDFNKKVQSMFNQALIAAAIQIVASTAAGYASKAGDAKGGDGGGGGGDGGKKAKGGLIPKFAFGGPVKKLKAGGMAGRDKIPALLMGNEYVMSPEATKYYGTQLMTDINRGTFRKTMGRARFAEGGLVGSGSSVSYQGNAVNNNFDQLVVAINTLNESINKNNQITQSEAGGITPNFNAQGQLASSSIVNNISINVSSGNVSGTSETNSENQNQDQTQDLQNNQKLAELLKGKIVEVIVEQKRPGGLLASVKP